MSIGGNVQITSTGSVSSGSVASSVTGTTSGTGELDRRERSAHVHEQLYARGLDRLERDDELRRSHGDVHELHGQRRDGAVHGGRSAVLRDERPTIYNMTVNNSGGATITLGGNFDFAAGGVLTLTKRVLDANGNTIRLGRD